MLKLDIVILEMDRYSKTLKCLKFDRYIEMERIFQKEIIIFQYDIFNFNI